MARRDNNDFVSQTMRFALRHRKLETRLFILQTEAKYGKGRSGA